MAVLVLQGVSDAGRLKGALAAIGGDLAQVGKSSAVAVFGQKTAENPVRRALRAAESLLGRGLAARALLEIATVTVQRRPDGSERFVSSAFNKIEQLITDIDPNGVYITRAVAASADDVHQEPLPDRDVIRVLAPRDDITDSATVMREAAVPLVGRGEVIDQLVASADAALRGGKPMPTIATVDRRRRPRQDPLLRDHGARAARARRRGHDRRAPCARTNGRRSRSQPALAACAAAWICRRPCPTTTARRC